MLVIVVSECEKRAFTRSRRVINKYLFQYGRRTWMGRLSEEGLADLRSELKAKASRHMAVACHRVVGTRRTELAWVVGTRRHFSQTGEYAFAVSERDVVRPVREKTPPERLVGHLAHLAGLLHDLGKCNAAFQDKLRQASHRGDAVRHELVSVLLLARLVGIDVGDKRWRRLPPDRADGERESWLAPLKNREVLAQGMADLAAAEPLFPEAAVRRRADQAATLAVFDFARLDAGDDAPVLRWLFWLLCSHHGLPRGEWDDQAQRVRPNAANQLNPQAPIEACQRMARSVPFWADPGEGSEGAGTDWPTAVAGAAGRLDRLLQSDELEPAGLFPLVEAHALPALIVADQVVSAGSRPRGSLGAQEAMLANTVEGEAGQPLAEHLVEVGRWASHFARLSLRPEPVAGIDPDELPEMLRQAPAPDRETERYRWQDRARQAVRRHVDDGIRTGGGFYLLMAGTGRGKTHAIPKLLSELSPGRLRYSLALGLRTLTLQSGDAYRNRIGFERDQVATLIGSRMVRDLHEADAGGAGGTNGSASREAFREAGASVRVEEGSTRAEGLSRELVAMLDPARRRLLATPVTVSTVDQLIGPVSQRTTGSVPVQLRLMTADLALDEIDQYSDRDLINVAKLVYLAGVYGRKVVLASATIAPAIARGLFAAYRAGWAVHCRRTAQDAPLFAGWIADEICIERDPNEAAFDQCHRAAVDTLLGQMRQAPVLRRAEVVPCGAAGDAQHDLRPLLARVVAMATTLHERHHTWVEGRRLSVGLVRWMNVAMCREAARYFVDEADTGAAIRVVCYHAGHIPAMRYRIERVLDDLLYRPLDLGDRLQAGEPGPGMDVLREAMDDTGDRDLMIVVSATPVADTGRDHDYDWAIWEPNDVRSAPQTAGRVFRHRGDAPPSSEPNFAILQRNWRSLVHAGETAPYRDPGPESDVRPAVPPKPADNRFRVVRYLDSAAAVDPGDYRGAGPVDLFRARVDARPTLEEDGGAPLVRLEHERLRWLLEHRPDEPTDADGLDGYIHAIGVRATDYHVRASPFRGGPGRWVEFFLARRGDLETDPWQWRWRGPQESIEAAARADGQSVVAEPALAHPERLLIRCDPSEWVLELAQHLGGSDIDTRVRELTAVPVPLYGGETANRVTVRFHPDLGAVRSMTRFPFTAQA